MLSSSAQSDPADAGGVLLARVLQRSCELVWRLPPAGLRDTWRPLVLVIGLAVDVEAASLFGRLAPGLLRDLVTFVRCRRPQAVCHLSVLFASRRRRSSRSTGSQPPAKEAYFPPSAELLPKLSAPGWTEGADSAGLRKAGRR